LTIKHTHGREGETLARAWLEKRGYRILSTNYRYRKYEIDIIAEKGEVLAIVEVKARGAGSWQRPSEALNRKQQRQIITAANAWVEEHACDLEVRLDLIAISLGAGQPVLEHFKGAFYPTL